MRVLPFVLDPPKGRVPRAFFGVRRCWLDDSEHRSGARDFDRRECGLEWKLRALAGPVEPRQRLANHFQEGRVFLWVIWPRNHHDAMGLTRPTWLT